MRNVEERDLEWITNFLNEKLYLDSFTLPQVRARIFEDPFFDPDLNILEEGKAVILGVKRGENAHIKIIAAEKGWGGRILEEWERRAKEKSAKKAVLGGCVGYFFPGLDPRYTEAFCFFSERGYAKTGEAIDMEVGLEDFHHEDREIPGVEIRRLERGDEELLEEFMLTNFSEGWLEETLRAYKNHPISCHIGLHEGKIIAFAGYEVVNPGFFGPTGTREDFRRRGIGGELLRRSLMDLKKLGYKKAIIPWVGPICFYWRTVRANVSRVYWHMEKGL